MAEEVHYIYIHIKPDTDEVFYVGKGKGDRYKRKSSRNKWWNNTVNKYGFESVKIEEGLSCKESSELEIYWISQFKAWGFNLTNITNGGEGMSGYKYDMGIYNKKIRPFILGRKQSEEEKDTRSVSAKENYKNKELRDRISKTMIDKNLNCKKVLQYNKDGDYIDSFKSITDASDKLGISRRGINNHLVGSTKSSGGYIFKYKD